MNPPTASRRRRVARVVVLDDADHVLLISARDASRPTAATTWFTPGGGAEAHETLEAAARREVLEETGARLGPLGPVVWRRESQFVFDGHGFDQSESFFVVRSSRFEVQPAALTDLEVRNTTGWRWWPLPELASTSELVFPPRLAHLVERWLADGPPPEPFWVD